MNKKRNVNLEFLRLLGMLLIVTSHFCNLYGTPVNDPAIPLNLLGIFAVGKWGGREQYLFDYKQLLYVRKTRV